MNNKTVSSYFFQGLDIEATLADHTNTVTCAEFLSHRPSLVVTGSKDRTFKVRLRCMQDARNV